MIIQIIIGVILAIAIYFIGFVRGAYKASEKNMKAYIELKKHQGKSWEKYVGRNNGDIQNKRCVMKQEDRELLLKDLCARLPYKVKVKVSEVSYPVELNVSRLVK